MDKQLVEIIQSEQQNQTKMPHTQKKLQANNPDEHRCKKPPQNISKPNSTMH